MKLNNPTENDLLALKVFEGLKPFTITVNNGADAMYLSLALLNNMTGNPELTNGALRLLIQHSKLIGVDVAIAEFFKEADERNITYPEFIKPILTLMINHMFDNKEKIRELVENEKEDTE